MANFVPNLAENRAIHASGQRGVGIKPVGVSPPKVPKLKMPGVPKVPKAAMPFKKIGRKFYGE